MANPHLVYLRELRGTDLANYATLTFVSFQAFKMILSLYAGAEPVNDIMSVCF